MSDPTNFTPAAGRFFPTNTYDWLLALFTREARWRNALLDRLAPQNGDRILDVGCGTASFAILIKQAAPDATVAGLDPSHINQSVSANKLPTADFTCQRRFQAICRHHVTEVQSEYGCEN